MHIDRKVFLVSRLTFRETSPSISLGTEWNASNWDELRGNGVTHVLNVTREVDNFFQVSPPCEECEQSLDHVSTWSEISRTVAVTQLVGAGYKSEQCFSLML